jgi:hypothetical protein
MNIEVERGIIVTPIIYLAKWGMSSFRSRKVTGELRGYLEAGIEPTASTQCLGDPYFKKNKYLRVKASIDGGKTKKWYTFREGDPVRFSSSKVVQ